MKQFNGYDEAKKEAQAKPSEKLPAGAYVCKVLGVRYEDGTDDKSDRIVLQIDVCEGEKKGFFKKQYDEDTSEDKKWKGRVSLYVPADDGSEKDKWTKKSFASWTDSFEKSNAGYSWDWDEKKWKGKVIGIVYGETGTVIDGREVLFTEARFPVEADLVRQGKAPVAKFKAKNGYKGDGSATTAPAPGKPATADKDDFVNIADAVEDEIPF